MANEVILVDKKTVLEMKNYYQSVLKSQTPPGAVFAAKKNTVNVTRLERVAILGL